MMYTRDEILSSPEYWFEDAQNELYAQVVTYMEQEGLNQSQLAERLNVSRGYISQVMKGEFNYTLKKLIELSLAVGKVPKIEYKSIAVVLAEDKKSKFIQYDGEGVNTSLPTMIPSESAAQEIIAMPTLFYQDKVKAA